MTKCQYEIWNLGCIIYLGVSFQIGTEVFYS